MAVNVFYVPSGSKNLKESILRVLSPADGVSTPPEKGSVAIDMLYIAGSSQVIAERMRALHGFFRGAYIQPEMVTISRLAKRLYSLFGDRVILPKSSIPVVISAMTGAGIGFSSVTAKFISEIKHRFFPSLSLALSLESSDKTALIEKVGVFLKTVFADTDTADIVSHRAMDALKVFGQYESRMEISKAVDEDDVLLLCPEIINAKVRVKVLAIDGLYEATDAEKAVLHSLINKAENTFIFVPVSNIFNEISASYIDFLKNNFKVKESYLNPSGVSKETVYHPFTSLDDEVEGIARHIKSSFISGRLRDLEGVVVAVPDIRKYRPILRRVFKRYGIPHTMAEPEAIAGGRPMLDVFHLLESVSEGYPRLPFMSFLSSPYFSHALPDELKPAASRLSADSGIIKGKEQWLKAFAGAGHEVHAAAKKALKKLETLESLTEEGDYAHCLNLTTDTLKALGFTPGSMSGVKTVAEMREALRWVALAGGISGREGDFFKKGFIEAVRHTLENTFVYEEGEGVRVMSLSGADGLQPAFLYMAGLKDGDMPSLPDMDHLLPDNIRVRLGFPDIKRHLMKQEFAFHRLIASSAGSYLTHPTMDGDKFFLPSLFLRDGREQRDRVSGIFSEEEALLKKGRLPLSAHIREISRLDIAGRSFFPSSNRHIHATDIDGYRRCPRRFFIEKVMGLKPLEVKEYEIEPAEIGTIIHQVMQMLVPHMPEDEGLFREAAESALEAALKDRPLEAYWKSLIKDSFLNLLPDIQRLERSIKADGYAFKAAEVPMEGELLSGIRIKGKIDRIDERDTPSGKASAIIDYKTGGTDLIGSRVLEKGASLQLFLYAALLKLHGVRTERVGIYSLRDVSLKWIPGRKDRKEGRGLDEYVASALGFLDETVKGMRQGDFSARPIDEQICKRCHERPYCPYIQGAEG